ncbi:hypothetical protein BC5_0022 [Bacillus phage BC-5]|uniref:Uncharacterized protein n=1 Tax=Bacillus phage BC-5 TaxID=3020389 RepID=A0AAF0BWE5_9CAUD|nr:hypothetical protein BC5_0022 [Bacillus phage BC-5]
MGEGMEDTLKHIKQISDECGYDLDIVLEILLKHIELSK